MKNSSRLSFCLPAQVSHFDEKFVLESGSFGDCAKLTYNRKESTMAEKKQEK